MRYRVDLSDFERTQLTALLNGGKHAARKIKRAQILLAADAGVSHDMIASSLSVSGSIDGLPSQAALCARQPGARDRRTARAVSGSTHR